jgi:hypothetical protein
MGKFWMERWVWAPQREPGGTVREPMASDSTPEEGEMGIVREMGYIGVMGVVKEVIF